jgi:hypothetical protein
VITPLSRLKEARSAESSQALEALEPPAQASVVARPWTYRTHSRPAPRDLRRDHRERVEDDAQRLGTHGPCLGPCHPVCRDVGARSDIPSPRAWALGAEELRDWKPGMHCVLAEPWGCARTSRRREICCGQKTKSFMAGSHSQLVELGKFLSEVLRWLLT